MSESSEDSQPDAPKRLGRPRLAQTAKPISRTVRIPLQTYDDITIYLKTLLKKTGKQIDRKDVIAHAWDQFRHQKQTANWNLVTGERRVILLTVIAFLAETPEGRPEAELVDSLLISMGMAVRMSSRVMRFSRKAGTIN